MSPRVGHVCKTRKLCVPHVDYQHTSSRIEILNSAAVPLLIACSSGTSLTMARLVEWDGKEATVLTRADLATNGPPMWNHSRLALT